MVGKLHFVECPSLKGSSPLPVQVSAWNTTATFRVKLVHYPGGATQSPQLATLSTPWASPAWCLTMSSDTQHTNSPPARNRATAQKIDTFSPTLAVLSLFYWHAEVSSRGVNLCKNKFMFHNRITSKEHKCRHEHISFMFWCFFRSRRLGKPFSLLLLPLFVDHVSVVILSLFKLCVFTVFSSSSPNPPKHFFFFVSRFAVPFDLNWTDLTLFRPSLLPLSSVPLKQSCLSSPLLFCPTDDVAMDAMGCLFWGPQFPRDQFLGAGRLVPGADFALVVVGAAELDVFGKGFFSFVSLMESASTAWKCGGEAICGFFLCSVKMFCGRFHGKWRIKLV